MEQRVLLSTMAMTNGGSPHLSCRARTSYGRMVDENITDRVKIQASYEPCKWLRFKQERKQSCNTSIVMESSAQKVCLHRGAFYLRSSLAGSSSCSQAKALTRRWVRKQIRYSLVRRPSETGTMTAPRVRRLITAQDLPEIGKEEPNVAEVVPMPVGARPRVP
jgi:hypothetical protein